uniref:Putative secreted protein n=1 Tax=Hyalomma excavatum TaxID=257692 RepID=A0A131XM22_9ACAR
MGLVSTVRQLWANYPEHVIAAAVVIALAPFGIKSAVDMSRRPWHYRTTYTVVRDDDPYAKVLEEAYKDFVPHKPPK